MLARLAAGLVLAAVDADGESLAALPSLVVDLLGDDGADLPRA